MLKEFREFISKGNAFDLAIGVIMGAAFGAIVNSLVKDVLMPPIGLIMGGVDFSSLFLSLSGQSYPTLAAAQAAGAPTLNYGVFLNQLVNFLIVAFVVFLLVKSINQLRRQPPPPEPTSRDCPFCLSSIPLKARRCAHCSADIPVAA